MRSSSQPDIVDGISARRPSGESSVPGSRRTPTSIFWTKLRGKAALSCTRQDQAWTPCGRTVASTAGRLEATELGLCSTRLKVYVPALVVSDVNADPPDSRLQSRCQSSLRIATRADLNVATRRPGLPWVWTTGPDMWNHRDDYDNRHAAFVQLTPRKRGHLQWTMFGDYNIIWAGYLEDGEFARLPPAKQRRTVELLLRYTRDKVAFARFIFRNCFVERENGTAVNVQAANKEEQEERVWKALMDNDGSLSVCSTEPSAVPADQSARAARLDHDGLSRHQRARVRGMRKSAKAHPRREEEGGQGEGHRREEAKGQEGEEDRSAKEGGFGGDSTVKETLSSTYT